MSSVDLIKNKLYARVCVFVYNKCTYLRKNVFNEKATLAQSVDEFTNVQAEFFVPHDVRP